MNSGTSDFLNASRWIAAFCVIFGHVCNVSITNYYDSGDHGLFLRMIHFFSGFGYISVIVFFVISGFLIGGRAILDFQEKGFSVIVYFVHRFSRIYTVLVPALIVGFILDRLGIAFFDASKIYNHPDPFYTNSFGNDIAEHLSFGTFVGNLLQLQTIVVSSLGSNGPLWSLANEWWYYVLFALGMISYRPGRLPIRIIAAGIFFTILAALPPTISLWFIVWGIGVGIAILDRYWAGWPFIVGAVIAAVCLIAARWITTRQWHVDMATQFALDLAVAFGFAMALLCAKNLKHGRKFGPLHRVLASFSYTVYLVHFPAMVFVAVFLREVFGIGFLRPPGLAAVVYAGALLAILYAYAWIFAWFTEARTNAVRLHLSQALGTLRYWVRNLAHGKIFERTYP